MKANYKRRQINKSRKLIPGIDESLIITVSNYSFYRRGMDILKRKYDPSDLLKVRPVSELLDTCKPILNVPD